MSSGFQKEFRDATDEPMREMRETANALRDSMDFRKFAAGEREEKPKSAEMAAATPTAASARTPAHTMVAPADSQAVPTGDAPFAAPAPDSRVADSDAIGPPVVIDPVDIAPETLPPEDQVEGT